MNVDILDLARKMYSVYGAVVGCVNYQGLPMPQFDQLTPAIIDAWCAVADFAVNHGFTLNEYQDRATETVIYPNPGHNLTYPVLGLVGEAGELANKYKKVLRDHDGVIDEETRQQMISETGDILWYTAAVADELRTSLADVAAINLNKLASRKKRGVVGGSGDDR